MLRFPAASFHPAGGGIWAPRAAVARPGGVGRRPRARGGAASQASQPGPAPAPRGPPIGPLLVHHSSLPPSPSISQARLRCAYVGLESGAGGVAFGARKEEGSKISTTVEAAWALGCVPAARRRRPRAHQGVPALWRRPGRVDAAPSLFPVRAAASRSRGFRGPGRSSRRRDTPFPHGLVSHDARRPL